MTFIRVKFNLLDSFSWTMKLCSGSVERGFSVYLFAVALAYLILATAADCTVRFKNMTTV